jgi:hypothetical protein
MDTLSPAMMWHRPLGMVALLVGCAGAAVLGRAAIQVVECDIAGMPVDWPGLLTLPFGRNDLYLPLFVAAFLAMELVQNGWRNSALRRALHAEDSSTRTDLV